MSLGTESKAPSRGVSAAQKVSPKFGADAELPFEIHFVSRWGFFQRGQYKFQFQAQALNIF